MLSRKDVRGAKWFADLQRTVQGLPIEAFGWKAYVILQTGLGLARMPLLHSPMYMCKIFAQILGGSGYFLTCRDMHRKGAAEVRRNLGWSELHSSCSRDCRRFQLATVSRYDARRTMRLGQTCQLQHYCSGQGPVWVCHVTGGVCM